MRQNARRTSAPGPMRPKGIRHLLLGLLGAFFLAACGTGGGGPQPTFQLSVPDAIAVPQGCRVDFQAYVSRPAGALGEVRVSVSGLPSGVSAGGATIPTGASGATLTLQAAATAPQGPATLQVTASLGAETRTAQVALTVQPASPEGVCPDIPATTKVADPASRQALSGFSHAGGTYTLRFSQATPVLLSLQAGDVLVSAPSERAPGGYLVKVTAVRQEGGEVVVTGTQAQIEEAIHQGQVSAEDQPLTPSGPIQPLAQGVQAHRISPQNARVTFDIVDVVLFDYNDGTVRARLVMNGQVTAEAGLDFVLDIRGRVGIPPAYIHRFLAQGRARLSGHFQVSGEARGAIGREIPIARVPFSAITFTIGPVPVVILPSMVFSVGANGEASVSFAMGTEINNTARAGIEYLDDRPEPKWRPVLGYTQSITTIGPDLRGALTARAYGRGGVGLDLYGVPTVSLGLNAYARLQAQARSDLSCPAAVEYGFYAGMDADVSLDITTVIGLPPVRHNLSLFELRLTGGFSGCPPTVRITSPSDGASVDLNRDFTVFVSVTDPMGQPVAVTWDPVPLSSGGGSGSFTAAYRFTREGPQRITATATTADGRRGQASINVNVANTPPTAVIDSPFAGQVFYLNPTATVNASGHGTDTNEDAPLTTGCFWRVDPDGLSAEGCNASFSFATPGERTLSLVVRDTQGLASSPATLTIRVENPPPNLPPTASITVSPVSDPYYGYQTLTLAASGASDPEGNLPLAFAWRAVKVDASGNPFGSVLPLGSTQTITWNLASAPTYSFLREPGASCQTADGQRVRIELVVTDSLGNAASPYTDGRTIRVVCPPG